VPNVPAEFYATPGIGWIPIGEAEPSVSSPPPLAEILESLRQEMVNARPAAFSRSSDPPPPSYASPADAPRSNFARRVESQLGFLRKSARRWHRDRAQADDLVQETVVQALANAHLWRGDQPDSNLRGWLFTIMRNRFLAGRARAKRSDAALDAIAAADECVPAVASRPEARLMLRDVERALARLPFRQRTAIRLVAVEGLSYDAAARRMGLSVAAVRCHLSRGRDRLRDLVEGRTAPPSRVIGIKKDRHPEEGARRPSRRTPAAFPVKPGPYRIPAHALTAPAAPEFV
jgi:RNA polymerase sigma-70 factor (ECF subfamily)